MVDGLVPLIASSPQDPRAGVPVNPRAVKRAFEQVDALGATAVTIFNAGAFAPGSVLDITPDEFERCWRVGCFGGFLVGQQAARRMAAAGAGSLFFTGATASLRGGANF